jgi:hypothetical protein
MKKGQSTRDRSSSVPLHNKKYQSTRIKIIPVIVCYQVQLIYHHGSKLAKALLLHHSAHKLVGLLNGAHKGTSVLLNICTPSSRMDRV